MAIGNLALPQGLGIALPIFYVYICIWVDIAKWQVGQWTL